MVSSPNVTALLGDWSRGDRTALSQLLPVVYAELRRVATRQLRRERADHTLQPTALVHEAYIRFWVDLEGGQQRQMTDFKAGFVTQNFDVSPDGTQIVFDRLRDDSDIVLMKLAR